MKNQLIIIIILLLFCACKTPSYLPKPIELKDQVKGLIFECKIDGKNQIIGEIIEVNVNEMILLPINETELMTLKKEKIETGNILVALTSDDPKKIKAWSTLVNLLPLGHGFYGIVTIPITLGATIPMSYDASKGIYRVNYPKDVYWEDMSKFARFPQGIPESINLDKIK